MKLTFITFNNNMIFLSDFVRSDIFEPIGSSSKRRSGKMKNTEIAIKCSGILKICSVGNFCYSSSILTWWVWEGFSIDSEHAMNHNALKIICRWFRLYCKKCSFLIKHNLWLGRSIIKEEGLCKLCPCLSINSHFISNNLRCINQCILGWQQADTLSKITERISYN